MPTSKRRFVRRPWSPYEAGFLRQHYGKMPTASIAGHLRRKIGMIHQAADRYGLMTRRRRWTPAELKFVMDRHAEQWCDSEIAAVLKCNRRTVGSLRERLGLPANDRCERYRQRVREKTREQLDKAGLVNMAYLRLAVWRERAKAAGWPEDLRPRAVEIMTALWERGPMTRRQIADAVGMPWKGSRKSLVSSDPEGSYLANLQARGLVVRLGRLAQGCGSGYSTNLYSLPLWIERGPVNDGKAAQRRTERIDSTDSADDNAASAAVDDGNARSGSKLHQRRRPAADRRKANRKGKGRRLGGRQVRL